MMVDDTSLMLQYKSLSSEGSWGLYSDTLFSRLCPSPHTKIGGDRGVELDLYSSCKRVGKQRMWVRLVCRCFLQLVNTGDGKHTMS